jgi:hypothetical protein
VGNSLNFAVVLFSGFHLETETDILFISSAAFFISSLNPTVNLSFGKYLMELYETSVAPKFHLYYKIRLFNFISFHVLMYLIHIHIGEKLVSVAGIITVGLFDIYAVHMVLYMVFEVISGFRERGPRYI